MWLHPNVPALFDILTGILASSSDFCIFLSGSVEKYATGPSAAIGSSVGFLPQL